MSGKVWNYKNKDCSQEEIKELSRQGGIPPLLALLLINRGITNATAAQKYIKKTLDIIHNPIDLTDIEKATERIIYAIQNNEKITIYGDYDVDGVTATALLVKFLKNHNANVDYYIPNRENEGYGINVMAVNKIAKTGTKLMITVDCGITACGEVELAKALGMDIIITDHHLCKEKLPAAFAVIDPKREDSKYPFDALSGVGVAFKLALAIAKELGEKTSNCFYEYVELAAIGTIADVVNILDENRVIVQKGILSMSQTKNEGIKALLKVSEANKHPINTTTISFMLAPRINAGGRLGSADKGVELLLCDNPHEAEMIANELEKSNLDRRVCEQKIFQEAIAMIESDVDFDKKRVIVLGKEGWHHGVIGIVASRICEKFYRPTILVSFDEKGAGKGSGRSVEGFHLFNALSESSDILTNFGGHAMAAGIGININDMEEFSKRLNENFENKFKETENVPKIDIDCELSPEMITIKNAQMLEYMEPFGEGNPKPIFSISGARVKKIEQMGSDKNHLKLVIEKDDVIMNAVGFRMGEYKNFKKSGDFVDVAFILEKNNFRGEESAQLILKDIK